MCKIVIPRDLRFLAVNEAEKGNCESNPRAVYSNKMFLFGPAAWGVQKICGREHDFIARAMNSPHALRRECRAIPSRALHLFYRGGQAEGSGSREVCGS